MISALSLFVACRNGILQFNRSFSQTCANDFAREAISPVVMIIQRKSYFEAAYQLDPNSLPSCKIVSECKSFNIAQRLKQCINLDSWTAYLNVREFVEDDIPVMLTTSRPVDEDGFMNELLSIPKFERVQFLDICHPYAWKSGEQFMILCFCAASDLSRLVAATLENHLLLNETLQINQLEPVNFTGTPSSLFARYPKSCVELVSESSEVSSAELSQPNVSTTYNSSESEGDTEAAESEGDTEAAGSSSKPPNILIYTGTKFAKSAFASIKATLQQAVGRDLYTIYHLKHEDVKTNPWAANCALLIVASEQLYENIDEPMHEYFEHGGTMLTFCSTIESKYTQLELNENCNQVKCVEFTMDRITANCLQGRYHYKAVESAQPNISLNCLSTNPDGFPVVLYAEHDNGGRAIFTQVHLEMDLSQSAVTGDVRAMLSSDETRASVWKSFLNRLGLKTCQEDKQYEVTEAYIITSGSGEQREKLIQAMTKAHSSKHVEDKLIFPNMADILLTDYPPAEFDVKTYLETLGASCRLGNTLIYQHVTKSTQPFAVAIQNCMPADCGLVVTAAYQMTGIGRGGNAWISPEGSLSMTYLQRIDLSSNLGQAPALIQTIPAVAICRIFQQRVQPNLEHKLSVKWPNDIYYNQTKIGGVIVTSNILGHRLSALVGVGVNLSNQAPTSCVNAVIHAINRGSQRPNIQPISHEEMVALVCKEVEDLTALLQADKQEYFNEYYKHWMHSGARVDVPESGIKEALILGLGEQGFLKLCDGSGKIFTVQPDGNSFDIMANLIKMKR